MIRRVFTVLTAGLLATGAAGCRGDSKPTIPNQLIEPPGPDADGGTGGGSKGKKDRKPKHTDTGEGAGASDG